MGSYRNCLMADQKDAPQALEFLAFYVTRVFGWQLVPLMLL